MEEGYKGDKRLSMGSGLFYIAKVRGCKIRVGLPEVLCSGCWFLSTEIVLGGNYCYESTGVVGARGDCGARIHTSQQNREVFGKIRFSGSSSKRIHSPTTSN